MGASSRFRRDKSRDAPDARPVATGRGARRRNPRARAPRLFECRKLLEALIGSRARQHVTPLAAASD